MGVAMYDMQGKQLQPKRAALFEQPFSRCWDSKECRVFGGGGKEERRRRKNTHKNGQEGEREERDKILCCVV